MICHFRTKYGSVAMKVMRNFIMLYSFAENEASTCPRCRSISIHVELKIQMLVRFRDNSVPSFGLLVSVGRYDLSSETILKIAVDSYLRIEIVSITGSTSDPRFISFASA
ncbi:hypothetical protein LINPERHAP2_LOCUS34894 [Linum perenne]